VIVKVDHFAAELGSCPHLRRHLRRPRVVEVRLAVVKEAIGPEVNFINILRRAHFSYESAFLPKSFCQSQNETSSFINKV